MVMKEVDEIGDERRDEVVEISESERLRLRAAAMMNCGKSWDSDCEDGKQEKKEMGEIEAVDGMEVHFGMQNGGGWKDRGTRSA